MQEDDSSSSLRTPSLSSVVPWPPMDPISRSQRNPKLHLFGMKRSGKTSIRRAVFHHADYTESLFFESTATLVKEEKTSFMNFDVYDYPANLNITDPETSPKTIFSATGAIIWVIDAQDEYLESIERLIGTLRSFAEDTGKRVNDTPMASGRESNFRLPPWISLNIFIHKIDGISEDFKGDIVADVEHRVREGLTDLGLASIATAAAFYQTSIYDQSIFEAIGKVFQKLIPSHKHATIEALINSLVSNCKLDKAYLFEGQWLFSIASDTAPGDRKSFEFCRDYLSLVRDINGIYGWREPPKDGVLGEKYDEDYLESSCTMERRGTHWLFAKGINKHLIMVCIMGSDAPDDNEEMIRYNFRVFQRGLLQTLAVPITSGFHA